MTPLDPDPIEGPASRFLMKGGNTSSPHLLYSCPGCNLIHSLRVQPTELTPCWDYNGNPECPTFSPSVLCRWNSWHRGSQVCHHYVKDGQIQFLDDCTHHLKGQTVPMIDFTWD